MGAVSTSLLIGFFVVLAAAWILLQSQIYPELRKRGIDHSGGGLKALAEYKRVRLKEGMPLTHWYVSMVIYVVLVLAMIGMMVAVLFGL